MRTILIAATLLAATAAAAEAMPRTCERTIIREARVLNEKLMHVRQRCESANVFFGGDWYCDFQDFRYAEYKEKFRLHVESRCRNEMPADIGWDTPDGRCPDYHGSGCTNAINGISDVVDCLLCGVDAAQREALDLSYAMFNLPSETHLNICQRTLGQRAADLFTNHLKALSKCELRNLSLSPLGTCPDGNTQDDMTAAASTMRSRVCGKCGGPDDTCDGQDDYNPSDIGFVPSCPAIAFPGGAACDMAIASLADVVSCVECFDRVAAGCLDALAAPTVVTPYPEECR